MPILICVCGAGDATEGLAEGLICKVLALYRRKANGGAWVYY